MDESLKGDRTLKIRFSIGKVLEVLGIKGKDIILASDGYIYTSAPEDRPVNSSRAEISLDEAMEISLSGLEYAKEGA